jgi:hypothetical protein
MAIEGLRPAPQHSNLHISREVGAWLRALDRLGLSRLPSQWGCTIALGPGARPDRGE